MAASTRASAASFSSEYRPRSCGEMRPSGDTAVASRIIRPAPDSARWPEVDHVPVAGWPSSAEYWHMGAMTMRFAQAQARRSRGLEQTAHHLAPALLALRCGMDPAGDLPRRDRAGTWRPGKRFSRYPASPAERRGPQCSGEGRPMATVSATPAELSDREHGIELAPRDHRQHGRHDDRVVRLLPLQHRHRPGVRQALLPATPIRWSARCRRSASMRSASSRARSARRSSATTAIASAASRR